MEKNNLNKVYIFITLVFIVLVLVSVLLYFLIFNKDNKHNTSITDDVTTTLSNYSSILCTSLNEKINEKVTALKKFDESKYDDFISIIPLDINSNSMQYGADNINVEVLINLLYSSLDSERCVPDKYNEFNDTDYDFVNIIELNNFFKKIYNINYDFDHNNIDENINCLQIKLLPDKDYLQLKYVCGWGAGSQTISVLDKYEINNDSLTLYIIVGYFEHPSIRKSYYNQEEIKLNAEDYNSDHIPSIDEKTILKKYKDKFQYQKITFKKNSEGNYYWDRTEILK